MSGVTIITPTGGRPGAFALCRKYVERQDYGGGIQWIVVDDCDPRMPPPTGNTNVRFSVTMVHPELAWRPGQNTLGRNILAALPYVKFDKVLICEDDDWYAPSYVSAQAARLDGREIVGEVPARYYHVPSGQYRIMDNALHASLCQTGMRASMLPLLTNICRRPSPDFIDVRLWRAATGTGYRRGMFTSPLSVGMKGLPGRPGIGAGHRPTGAGWRPDPGGAVLRSWVGADAPEYGRFRGYGGPVARP